MTLELEDRLWAQLEAAALRETRRRPAARAAAAKVSAVRSAASSGSRVRRAKKPSTASKWRR